MASFTKQQILNFLESKAQEAVRGATTPAESSTRFLFLRLCKILVEKDVILASDINTAFVEWV